MTYGTKNNKVMLVLPVRKFMRTGSFVFMEEIIMRFNIEEKKILYAFGCSSYKNTVERIKWLAALAVDTETKRTVWILARKIDQEGVKTWYRCFYKCLRIEMEGYFLAGKVMRMAEKSTDREDRIDETI